jgi:hypothetical protein
MHVGLLERCKRRMGRCRRDGDNFSATRRKQEPSGGGVAGVSPMALAYRDDQHIAHCLEIRCYFTSAPLPYHQFAPLLGFD